MENIKKFIKKNRTALLIALGVIAVAVVAWLVWRRRTGVVTEDVTQTEQYTGQSVTAGMQWRDMAERLLKAFSGPNASLTDEAEVYKVLGKLNNDADWDYMKRYWTTYYDALPWWKKLHAVVVNGSNNNSLVVLMKYELDNSELQRCRDILEAKGITPDF